ncbi:helix-turn-helix transcriptional regulator [Desulfovibrio sp. OttesenSCG-928-M14]|nr:helix-turn-helix transcriptional regulator [Desulfovibrio sp. OttesenSCG-928-M14]
MRKYAKTKADFISLRELRKALGLTQKQLAEALQVSQAAVRGYRRGPAVPILD